MRNAALTLQAKGLLSQILSLPENWDYTLAGLSRINRESTDAIRTAVQELERAGYITRSRERKENGQLGGADYIIHEQPPEGFIPDNGTTPPLSGEPTQDKPMGKRMYCLMYRQSAPLSLVKRGLLKKLNISASRNSFADETI